MSIIGSCAAEVLSIAKYVLCCMQQDQIQLYNSWQKMTFPWARRFIGKNQCWDGEKNTIYKFNLEDLEVKLHIEILSDAAIFLLLGVLGRGTGRTPRGCSRPP